ncbi:hypothetical protein ACFU7T_07170 [Streptomyces sp. NPDC057555]|uniref:hypothetical protein n=1 Tax=Streptomyces sp. NPDC057555 TaxID=3346166 RepID=UPI0036A78F04
MTDHTGRAGLASVPAGRAVENYAQAFAQLGLLRRFAEAPATADLRDARLAAFCVDTPAPRHVR